jgi:glycosyltransferase involved in cell wall biosynthesis
MNNLANKKLLPLVSILIPLYNAEKYFKECLESVINQTYKNLEVIIINDGSTDGSLTIAQKYAKKYTWIKVYSQENHGASVARNKAFSYSKGDYIQYLDADDIMHLDKIMLQIQALKKYDFNPEIVTFGKWSKFFHSTNNMFFSTLAIYKDYDNTLKFLIDSWNNAHYSIIHSWLISKELHLKVGKWDERISVLDDSIFFAKVAYNAKKIIFSSESIVYWRQDNEISLSKDKSRQGMESHLLACDSYIKIVEKDLDSLELKQALALEYSKFIYCAYPRYMDLVEQAEESIAELGFAQPLPLPTKKFRFFNKIIGFYSVVRLFSAKDRLMKKLRDIKK